jgi:nucleoid DNA-binding protein
MAKKTAKADVKKPAPEKKAKDGAVKPATKGEIYGKIAEKTGLSKKDVGAVFDALTDLVKSHLNTKKGPGLFVLPGLLKLRVVKKPATKEKEGKNPFTGEPMIIKAKPARNSVKATPLKALKDSV